MASSVVLSFRPAGIRACASAGGDRRSEGRGKRSPSSGNWWNPIFGWPSDPDYIDGETPEKKEVEEEEAGPPARVGSRYGAFTEEKARELRMKSMETETFHDAMYHSAIASRLASDPPRRSDR